jgi:hypothetical protein
MSHGIRSNNMIETLEAVKASLLPLPSVFTESLSLRYHIALQVMRLGIGSGVHLETLIRVIALARFLAADGYGEINHAEIAEAQEAARAALSHGQNIGAWILDDAAFESIARIVTLHDEQLRIAPFVAVAAAGKKLDQFL